MDDATRTLINSMLPKHTDTEIAAAAKCSARTVARLRKDSGHGRQHEAVDWSKYDHLVGQINDAALARRIGRSTATVFQRRKELGREPAPGSKRVYVDWSKYDDLLGTMRDSELAEKAGCSPTAVRLRRLRKGVKPYSKSERFKWSIPKTPHKKC